MNQVLPPNMHLALLSSLSPLSNCQRAWTWRMDHGPAAHEASNWARGLAAAPVITLPMDGVHIEMGVGGRLAPDFS